MAKHYKKINKKELKPQGGIYCQECGREIDTEKDYFILHAYWKVKKRVDKYRFCSLKCLSKWANK